MDTIISSNPEQLQQDHGLPNHQVALKRLDVAATKGRNRNVILTKTDRPVGHAGAEVNP